MGFITKSHRNYIFIRNQDKIDWNGLCLNPTSEAIELLRENKDKIFWDYLVENPMAIELLEENIDKINWTKISINPSIFEPRNFICLK